MGPSHAQELLQHPDQPLVRKSIKVGCVHSGPADRGILAVSHRCMLLG